MKYWMITFCTEHPESVVEFCEGFGESAKAWCTVCGKDLLRPEDEVKE